MSTRAAHCGGGRRGGGSRGGERGGGALGYRRQDGRFKSGRAPKWLRDQRKAAAATAAAAAAPAPAPDRDEQNGEEEVVLPHYFPASGGFDYPGAMEDRARRLMGSPPSRKSNAQDELDEEGEHLQDTMVLEDQAVHSSLDELQDSPVEPSCDENQTIEQRDMPRHISSDERSAPQSQGSVQDEMVHEDGSSPDFDWEEFGRRLEESGGPRI
ncbi:hypothetical protein BU25DRAFT_448133 [Macroventuria anomochaeta]|uniref:Uncharacterized protein n=1 Tax=Macroventuria anomochaeta TaxID=301207 RepID=A0ACB6S462_9PLEO|nr:uncharacterized protein BU25DRAFT_448133 [Macroventuria anomochaeta]KAF2628169.1 hypothetical protein BU25DRAFT_448133 [Macroventuria anomochaeta]